MARSRSSKLARPQVLIGSSRESLDLAHAVQANLDRYAEVTVWDQDLVRPSQWILEAIVEHAAQRADFGVFVFAPDDRLVLRGKQYRAVRDNVLFELGVFMGALGVRRCFVVHPEGVNLRLPTDLLGLAPALYTNRQDGNWRAATGPACSQIGHMIEEFGARVRKKADARVLEDLYCILARSMAKPLKGRRLRLDGIRREVVGPADRTGRGRTPRKT